MGKIAILLKSGNYTDFMTMSMIVSGAVVSDMDVIVFAMNDSVWGLLKENCYHNTTIHSNFIDFAHTVSNSLNEGKVKPWWELMEEIKELGNVKLVVCALVADLGGFEKEDFIDLVDEIAGVAYFAGEAESADVVLTI